MNSAPLQAWHTDHSQIQVRRQACMAATDTVAGQLVVLLVDQSPAAQDLVESWQGQPVEIYRAPDLATGLLRIGQICPDAIIVGSTTGALGRAEFLRTVRTADDAIPIILTTPEPGNSRDADTTGATAVVPHPYRPRELLALLMALSAGQEQVQIRPMPIDLGRLKLDGAVPRMWLDGTEIALPLMEFLVLRYLAARNDAVISRQEIVDALWNGDPRALQNNTVTVHIKRLRKRLGDDAYHPTWIRSVRGLGYRLTVPPPSIRS